MRVARNRRQGGYSLILLVMIFTCLSILVAAALPAIEQVIKRNREEEMIFRGFQYAEAIRVFQRRFGRYPIRLEELAEVKPRCIRQLWKDPLSDDGKWAIVTVNGNRGAGGVRKGGAATPPNPDDQAGTAVDAGDRGQPGENLPILGVVSRSNKEAVKTLFGRSHYNEWRFTAEVLRVPTGVGPNGSISRVANATWIGRPFRSGLVQPAGGVGGIFGGGAPPPGSPGGTPGGTKGPSKPPPPRSSAPPGGGG
ncbi:MAG: type II secretion system protein [Acidobacteriota bacterium]